MFSQSTWKIIWLGRRDGGGSTGLTLWGLPGEGPKTLLSLPCEGLNSAPRGSSLACHTLAFRRLLLP